MPRLILNDDGSNFLYSWDDMGADDLRAYLRRLRGTQVDMVAYCVAFGGYVTYYDSQVGERIGTGFGVTDDVKQARVAGNLRRLDKEAGGYLTCVFETLRDMGLPVVASFRMNDAHMSSDPVGPVAGRFWMNHPQWRLGESYGYYASCLDYSVPEVREVLRQLVLEFIGLYPDIAGIELDGLRSPFFFPEGEGERCAPIMTEFIRQIRADLKAAGNYHLRVNVPRSPKLALESGMDVATWDEEGLVDGVSPGCYNTDFQIPTATWKQLLSRTPVQPYVNCSAQTGQYLSLEEYRGATANAWNAGADGVYLFNFPCLDELSFTQAVPPTRPPFPAPEFGPYAWHADQQETRQALYELGDAEQMRRADKRFLFCMEETRYRHYVPDEVTIDRLCHPEPRTAGAPSEGPLAERGPSSRSGSAPQDDKPAAAFTFHCYEDFAAAREITLELKLVGVSLRDQFAFSVNDQAVPGERVTRLHSASGRDARVHSVSLDPYSQYTLKLDARRLTPGANILEVTLTQRHPALLGTVQLREVKLDVKY